MSKLKSRSLLRKKKNQKGLKSLGTYLQKLDIGTHVVVKPCEDLKRSVPNRRFCGKIGCIVEAYLRSNHYKVLLGKRTLVLPKAHLKVV